MRTWYDPAPPPRSRSAIIRRLQCLVHGHAPQLQHMLSSSAAYCVCAHCGNKTAAYIVGPDRSILHIPWAKVAHFYTHFSGSHLRAALPPRKDQ